MTEEKDIGIPSQYLLGKKKPKSDIAVFYSTIHAITCLKSWGFVVPQLKSPDIFTSKSNVLSWLW
jgi:hypothetical protein